MKTCNSCGAEMNDNDRFCMQCGKDQTVSDATKVCISCGAQMNAKDRFCMACGKDQEATTEAAPKTEETTESATPVAEPVAEPVVEAAPAPTYSYTESTSSGYSYDSDSAPEGGDGKATASMVCGIIGLVLCGCMPLGVAALICGILAKKDGSTSGKATAGIIMGGIVLALWVLSLIINIATGAFTDILNALN